jgi:uncharacterized protein
MVLTRRLIGALSILSLLVIQVLPVVAASKEAYYGYLWVRSISMSVPAVMSSGGGYTGVMSKLTVTIAWPGSGTVYVAADPLTELDIQAAARIAAFVSSVLAGYDPQSFDFFVRIEADSPIIGGPSASGAMAVGFLAILRGKSVSREFSMTGMIEPDSVLGPVGGVPEKLRAAAEAGIKVFVVPAGQGVSESLSAGKMVDVVKLGEKLGVEVHEARTVLDAYAYATGDRSLIEEYNATDIQYPGYPDWVTESFKDTIDYFKPLAQSNMSCAKEYASRLSPSLKSNLIEYIQRINATLDEAERALSEEQYYTAASRYFVAAIDATKACILARALSSRDLQYLYDKAESLIENANKTVGKVYEKLKTRLFKVEELDDVKLQMAIAVLDRVSEARAAVSQAETTLKALRAGLLSSTLDNIMFLLDAAVYAYYRSVTTTQWLELMDKAPQGSIVTMDRLGRVVSAYTYFAYSEASYAKALGLTDKQADEYISLARSILSSAQSLADYVEALTYAVKGYTRYTIRLREAFSVGVAGVDAARQALVVLTNMALKRGLQPILPILYEDYASMIEDLEARLSLYSQAASYALLLNMLAKLSTKPTGLEEKATTITKTITTTITLEKERNYTVTIPVKVTIPHTINKTVVTTSTVVETTTKTKTIEVGETVSTITLLMVAVISFAAGFMLTRKSS